MKCLALAAMALLPGCSPALFHLSLVGVSAWQAERSEPTQSAPLAPGRRVNEVDCTQPIDLSLGNIRCK